MSQEEYTEKKRNTKPSFYFFQRKKRNNEYLRFKTELTSQSLVRVSEEEKKREEGVRNSFSQLVLPFLHSLSQTVSILCNKRKIQNSFLRNTTDCSEPKVLWQMEQRQDLLKEQNYHI